MPTSHAGPRPAAHDELTLFAFDDFSLPFQHNLALHMVGGRKHPENPVLRRSTDGPDAFGLQMGTILGEDGRHRYWYGSLEEAFDQTSQPSLPLHLCYAESAYGVHWRRPNLGLASWRGSTANNLIPIEPQGAPGAHPVHCPAVLYDPEDPDPARRYKITCMTWVPADQMQDARNADTGDPTGPYGLMQTAVSPDGLRWRLATESLPLPEWFEVNGLHRFNGWYYATCQQFAPWIWLPGGRECGRVMVAFRSHDFVHWLRAKALAFQRPAQKSAPPGSAEDVHMGAGLWNRGNVMLGLYGQFHGTPVQFGPDVSVDLGLIVSNDGCTSASRRSISRRSAGGVATWAS
jgi:hypothetical protein